MKDSPGLKYSPESPPRAAFQEYDKENSGNLSNVIQPYSPPRFPSDPCCSYHKREPLGARSTEALPELYPQQHSVSPSFNNSSPSQQEMQRSMSQEGSPLPAPLQVQAEPAPEIDANLYPSVAEIQHLSDAKSEIKSMEMFNHSINSGNAESTISKEELKLKTKNTSTICKLKI